MSITIISCKHQALHTFHKPRSFNLRPFTSPANIFGDAKSAEFLASAHCPNSIPPLHGLPEIVVTGRANVGKSTLLNAVLGRTNLLNTSKKPGRTQSLNFFRVGREPGTLIVVDAPGYGSRGRPEWGTVFKHYVEHRKALRRVYVLLNAKHGVTSTDIAMLQSLNAYCLASSGLTFTLQAIITKANALAAHHANGEREMVVPSGRDITLPAMRSQIFDAAPTCLPPIITSALMRPPFGIEEVRKSIVEACGLGVV